METHSDKKQKTKAFNTQVLQYNVNTVKLPKQNVMFSVVLKRITELAVHHFTDIYLSFQGMIRTRHVTEKLTCVIPTPV